MSTCRGWEDQKKAYRWMYHSQRPDVIEEIKAARAEACECGHRPLIDLCKAACAFLVFFLIIGLITGAFSDIMAEFLESFSSNRLLIGVIIGVVAFFFSYIKKRDAHDIEEMEARNSGEFPEQNSRTFRA